MSIKKLIKKRFHRYWHTRQYRHSIVTIQWFVLINILHYYDARQCGRLFQWLTDWSSTACLPYHLTSATYRNRVEVSKHRRLEPVLRHVRRLSDTFETSVRCARVIRSVYEIFQSVEVCGSVFIAAPRLPRHVALPSGQGKGRSLYWLFG